MAFRTQFHLGTKKIVTSGKLYHIFRHALHLFCSGPLDFFRLRKKSFRQFLLALQAQVTAASAIWGDNANLCFPRESRHSRGNGNSEKSSGGLGEYKVCSQRIGVGLEGIRRAWVSFNMNLVRFSFEIPIYLISLFKGLLTQIIRITWHVIQPPFPCKLVR